jgi:hypothetical protein
VNQNGKALDKVCPSGQETLLTNTEQTPQNCSEVAIIFKNIDVSTLSAIGSLQNRYISHHICTV